MLNLKRIAGFSFPSRRQALHWLPPVLLLLLFLSTLLWLPWQAQQMEATERQEQLIADTLWVEQTIRFQVGRNEENIRLIGAELATDQLSGKRLQDRMTTLIRNNRELARIAWFDDENNLVESTDDFPMSFSELPPHSKVAAEHARSSKTPQYGQPAPPHGMAAPMLMDYHLPVFRGNRYIGSLVASYSVPNILD
jgi:two-component system sensor histidine kinase DctS